MCQQQRQGFSDVYSLAWVSWLLMSVSVSAKVSVIIIHCIEDLEEEAATFWSANTLKTTIALGACIFLLLLITQHDAALGSEGRRYIEELTGTVVFDILDTVEIFDILLEREALWHALEETILGVAVVNLLLPTVPLFTLARTQFGRKKLHKRLIYLHRILVVMVVNVPNLIVRMVLWHGHSMGISPFTLKNVVLIVLTAYEFYEHKKMKFKMHEQERLELECEYDGEGDESKKFSEPKTHTEISNEHEEFNSIEKDRFNKFKSKFDSSSGSSNAGKASKSDREPKERREYNGDFGIEARVLNLGIGMVS